MRELKRTAICCVYKYGWKLKSQLYHPFISCHKWIGLGWLFLFGFVTRHSMYFGWNVSSGLWFTIWLKANFSHSRVQEAGDGFSFHALLTCSEILQESIWLLLANNGKFLHTSDPLLVEEALSKTSDPDMDRFRGALDIFFYTFIVIVWKKETRRRRGKSESHFVFNERNTLFVLVM